MVTGGSGESGGQSALNTTEQLDINGQNWTLVFTLPTDVYGHCVVSINASTILYIGGGTSKEGSNETYFIHNDNTFVVS